MKKSFLLSVFLIVGLYSFAQKFMVIPAGLVNADDTSKHYVVMQITGISAKELYSRANLYIQEILKNPDNTMGAKKEGEFLQVKMYAKNAVAAKGGLGIKIYLNLRYGLNLDFKDGKVKYEITDLEMNNISPYVDEAPFYIQSTSPLYRSIYNKNGILIKKERSVKKQLENYFNSQITDFKTSIIAVSSKTDF